MNRSQTTGRLTTASQTGGTTKQPPKKQPPKSAGAVHASITKTITSEQVKERFRQEIKIFKKRDQRYGRWIIIGTGKSGKSWAAIRTLPTPILFAIFDPDTEQLIPPEMIEQGLIYPKRYYGDLPDEPEAYREFDADLTRWKKEGFFDYFASVIVDSLSSLMISQLREIAKIDVLAQRSSNKKVKRTSLMPQLQDYNVLKVNSILTFTSLSALPCHVVLNAHILEERDYRDKDDVTGFIRKTLNATPALKSNIPQLFSEVYLAESVIANKESGKLSYIWKTRRDKRFKDLPLGSRMTQDTDRVPFSCPQNFRELLKVCDFHYQDKSPLI